MARVSHLQMQCSSLDLPYARTLDGPGLLGWDETVHPEVSLRGSLSRRLGTLRDVNANTVTMPCVAPGNFPPRLGVVSLQGAGRSCSGFQLVAKPEFPSRGGLVKVAVWLKGGLGTCLRELCINRQHAVFI